MLIPIYDILLKQIWEKNWSIWLLNSWFYHVMSIWVGWNLRFNERRSQCTRYACGMCIIQFEYTFNDGNLGRRWAHANECAPIVHNTASSKNFTTTIHGASLNNRIIITKRHEWSCSIWRQTDLNNKQLMTLTTSGICSSDDNSSWSSTDVFGCTMPPWLLSTEYDPTKTLLATVWRKTSTFKTSPMISSVS